MVDPYRREVWRAEARARRAESRGGVSDRRSGVFKHSWHSVWLLWHLNSVWCLKHLSTPRMDKCKWQNDREGLHFYKNITRSEKYPNIDCTETGKGAASQLWGTGSVIRGSGSQIRGAGSEIRRDPPPQLNPCLKLYRQALFRRKLKPFLFTSADSWKLHSNYIMRPHAVYL